MPNFIEQKRFLRKLIARTLQLLVHIKPSQKPIISELKSVVILAQEKLGDSILLTPLLKNLRHYFPDCEIHLICFSTASANFFRNDPHITAIHQVKKEFGNYFRHVLCRKFDILFNTKDSPSTNFLLQCALIRAQYKVGHRHQYHDGLFHYFLDVDFHTSMALKNCALLSLLKVKLDKEKCRPYLPPAPVSRAMTAWLEQSTSRACIGLNISAGSPARYWSEEKWSTLITQFSEQQFIIFAAPQDSASKQRLEQHRNVTATPATGNLYEVGLLVNKVQLLITPDTAMVHVASCYAIPVIGLYTAAPQDMSRFAPYLVDYELISSNTPNVGDIEVGVVIRVLKRKLVDNSW